jgi:hypothetical protein
MRGDRGRPMTPGPGQYEYKTYVGKEAPRITMSISRPQTSGGQSAFVPGPGQYNSSLTNKQRSPSYSIGNSKRDKSMKHLEALPGPGMYSPTVQVTSTRPKSPTWSMGKGTRNHYNATESVPGPGNYNVSKGIGEGPKV